MNTQNRVMYLNELCKMFLKRTMLEFNLSLDEALDKINTRTSSTENSRNWFKKAATELFLEQ